MSAEPPHRWTVKVAPEVREWLRALRQTDPDAYRSVNVAIDMLAESGPGLGRPLVDTLRESTVKISRSCVHGRAVMLRYG
nr:hypothetical protein [Frankia sp. CiP3]